MTSNFNPNPRVKLVGLMKTGIQNVTWYNFKKHNTKSKEQIIDGMKVRFFKVPGHEANCQVLQFYDAVTGQKLEEYKHDQS